MYDLGLVPIICKVRWGRKAKDGYVHGVSIQNINDEQRGLMCYELRQLISKVAKQLAKEQKAPNIVSNPKPGTHLQHNSRNPPIHLGSPNVVRSHVLR